MAEHNPGRASASTKRYFRDMALSGSLYVACVIVAALLIRHAHVPQWAAVVLAILPTAPAVMMLRAYLAHVAALDEFQRRLQTEGLIVAAGVVVFGTFAYGFLEEWANAPHLSLIWIFPIFSFVFGIAHMFIRRRYK